MRNTIIIEIKKLKKGFLPKIMKTSIIFFISSFFCYAFAERSYSQTMNVTLELQNVTVEKLFQEIESHTEFVFLYKKEVDTQKNVSVHARNENIETVLTKALAPLNYSYRVNGKQIVVTKNKELTRKAEPTVEQQSSEKNVSGKVTDKNGDPMIGVAVTVKGTSKGISTDLEGNFYLNNVPDNAVLEFSYIGYQKHSLDSKGKTVFSVVLQEEQLSLDEVVVVGFGVQKKVNLTGSVATTDSKTFEERPVANAVNALQGIIPGLNIMNSGNGGELDEAKSIRIRGNQFVSSNSSDYPLILIDGMEGSMTNINPQDIESISVLKDAAAASIYGSRAPYGVILVTTKSGQQGKTTINYNNSFRFNTPVLLPRLQDSWEFVNYFDDAQFNGTNNHLYDADYLKLVKDYYDGKTDPKVAMYIGGGDKWFGDYAYGNVDWMREYYQKWSPSQEHNLSASGGTNKVTYYVSANVMDQNGFMRYGTENYTRYTIMGKIASQLTKALKVEYTGRFSRTDYDRPTAMNDGFYNDILRRARPVRPIYDPNGYYASDINYIDVMQNGGKHNDQNDETRQQIKITLTPLKNWNIVAEMNMNFSNSWSHEDANLIYSHYATDAEKTYKSVYSPANSYVSEYASKRTFLNPNVYTNYTKSFGNHNFTGTAGFQYENVRSRALSGSRNDMITPDLPILDLTSSTEKYSLGGNYNEWATTGFFGRLNYDYKGRYLAELNFRYDGSSRFRSDSRWVSSPSASLGWNIARENFWETFADRISMLKFRLSYGQLANQNTDLLYPTYQTMGVGSSNGLWIINSVRPNTSTVPSLISTSLTWEKVKTLNFGLDWGALNNHLTGSFDYFIRNTDDMVGAGVELPAILGTAVPNTNNTAVKTVGWELQLEWRDAIQDFSYGVRLNVSDARTKIVKYANPTGRLGTDATSQTKIEGHWLGAIYGYETIGIAKTDEEMQAHLATLPNGGQDALGNKWAAGDIMYRDLNGDGKINNGSGTIYDMGDLTKLGDNTPRFLTGINIDASWKNISFQMFWQGVLKKDFAPWNMLFWGANSGGQWWSTGLKEHLDYFRADADHPLGQNLDAYYPRPLFNSAKNTQIQSRYMQNAAYMRLKNLQLGYTLPVLLTNKVKLGRVKLFVSGENLLTITSLTKVLDPETAGIGKHGGIIYPLSRTYSFGINVNF